MFGEHYTKGRRHYDAGDYVQAADAFREALRFAKSDFAKGEAKWWLALCRAWVARRYNSYGVSI